MRKTEGSTRDKTTLSAWQLKMQGGEAEYAFGISEYLPYGTYVLAEQQPFKAQWMDFENRHYRIDPPKEIVLPSVYEDGWAEIRTVFQRSWCTTVRSRRKKQPAVSDPV